VTAWSPELLGQLGSLDALLGFDVVTDPACDPGTMYAIDLSRDDFLAGARKIVMHPDTLESLKLALADLPFREAHDRALAGGTPTEIVRTGLLLAFRWLRGRV
jgi:hypothetical protein